MSGRAGRLLHEPVAGAEFLRGCVNTGRARWFTSPFMSPGWALGALGAVFLKVPYASNIQGRFNKNRAHCAQAPKLGIPVHEPGHEPGGGGLHVRARRPGAF